MKKDQMIYLIRSSKNSSSLKNSAELSSPQENFAHLFLPLLFSMGSIYSSVLTEPTFGGHMIYTEVFEYLDIGVNCLHIYLPH